MAYLEAELAAANANWAACRKRIQGLESRDAHSAAVVLGGALEKAWRDGAEAMRSDVVSEIRRRSRVIGSRNDDTARAHAWDAAASRAELTPLPAYPAEEKPAYEHPNKNVEIPVVRDWYLLRGVGPWLPPQIGAELIGVCDLKATDLGGRTWITEVDGKIVAAKERPINERVGLVSTTKIVRCAGRRIWTEKGQCYDLGAPDTRYVAWLADQRIVMDWDRPFGFAAETATTATPAPAIGVSAKTALSLSAYADSHGFAGDDVVAAIDEMEGRR
ncbi:MAG: hypothetical protein WC700_14975 [Gemmatimonadaceae bacterium]